MLPYSKMALLVDPKLEQRKEMWRLSHIRQLYLGSTYQMMIMSIAECMNSIDCRQNVDVE